LGRKGETGGGGSGLERKKALLLRGWKGKEQGVNAK